MIKKKAIFNWSGGKDSALALYHTLNSDEYEIMGLLTTLNEKQKRISMHGVREELLEMQAKSIGLPLFKLYLPEKLKMDEYDDIISNELNKLKDLGVTHSIFGDIFLEDLREYRVKQLETIGLEAVFPLWKRDTKEIANEFVSLEFKAIITAVDASKLDKSVTLSDFDDVFIKNLPSSVDVCGENGEFHSFVWAGPIFSKPVNVSKGDIISEFYKDDGHQFEFYFGDLISIS